MTNVPHPINVILADDHSLFRQSLARILRMNPKISNVSEAINGLEVLELVKKQKCDIILLDIDMPEMNGFEVLKHFQPIPAPPIIVVSFSESGNYIFQSYELGAKGYVLKGCDIEELYEAISSVVNGSTYFTPHAQKSLLLSMGNKLKTTEKFNSGELDVLKLVCHGKSSKEIGDLLNISKRTVDSRRISLLKKTSSLNTAELVSYANRNGLD